MASVTTSSAVHVAVHLDIIRRNAQAIAARVGVPVLATVKANAYGLGAAKIAEAIADAVDGFCVFSLAEAIDARLWDTAKRPILAMGPPPGDVDASTYLAHHVRPAVSTVADAHRLRAAHPVLSIDTGMQ